MHIDRSGKRLSNARVYLSRSDTRAPWKLDERARIHDVVLEIKIR